MSSSTTTNTQKEGHSVQGKVVLITGANRGIGKALVEAFVEHGATKIYAAVRTLESAQPLVDKFAAAASVEIVPVYMDLSKPESITTTAATITDVDIVINNAGILTYTSPLHSDAVANMKQEMQVNVYGFMTVAQAFAPLLKQKGKAAALCQINSVGSLRSHPAVATYAATKAASYAITQSLRMELQPHGVHVMSVHPGPVMTDMVASNAALQKHTVAAPEDVAQEVIRSLQAGEFLCFPDPLAKSLSQSYKPFAEYVFEQGNMY